jgi:hypothetical protein
MNKLLSTAGVISLKKMLKHRYIISVYHQMVKAMSIIFMLEVRAVGLICLVHVLIVLDMLMRHIIHLFLM